MTPSEQRETFKEQGFLILEDGFSAKEVAILQERAEKAFAEEGPGRTVEKDGRTVRGVHGTHRTDEAFGRLVRHPKVLGPAHELLGRSLYVHQFKINAKRALTGDVWPWHQDYIFWNRGDGMARPAVINVGIFLDDATEFNGPLLFVPGSHRIGMLDLERKQPADGSDDWESNLAADLDYSVGADQLAELTAKSGIVSATGPAGSIMLFDSLIVHSSGSNMSAHDRGMVLVTYNQVDNRLPELEKPRPEFLASRDYAPLELLAPGETL